MSGDYNTPEWRRLSALITTGATCARCGASENLHAHHKVPRALGGTDTVANLVALCASCHPRVEAVTRLVAGLDRVRTPPARSPGAMSLAAALAAQREKPAATAPSTPGRSALAQLLGSMPPSPSTPTPGKSRLAQLLANPPRRSPGAKR